MKIHILSDLHLEFGPFAMPDTEAEVVVLAGDTHLGTAGVEWALSAIPDRPVIYVMGNHEYYRHSFPDLLEECRRLSAGSNVHLLENEALVVNGVRFLGCTLWSDFNLFQTPDLSMLAAGRAMNDFRMIRHDNRPLRPAAVLQAHRQSRAWLEEQLAQKMKTVVVTHNAPSILSVEQRYKMDELTPAFASPLEEFILDAEIDLWVHGHLHNSVDCQLGKTRVLCNPRGYVPAVQPGFVEALVVEV